MSSKLWSYAEITDSDWFKTVIWLRTPNNSTLFKSSIIMLLDFLLHQHQIGLNLKYSLPLGGAVALDGRIEPGDMILQVNDISFENMSNDDAVRVLKEVVQKPG